jgi:hypothetical protein
MGHSRPDLARELERLLFDAERERYVPALLCVPEKRRPRPVVYLDQAGKASGLRAEGAVDELARGGYVALVIDPAGIGETAGGWGGGSAWFGQEKIAWLALMTGRLLVGLRMADVVRGIDVLGDRGLGGKVIGIARGMLGVDLLHTAVIDSRLGAVVLDGSLVSFASSRLAAESPDAGRRSHVSEGCRADLREGRGKARIQGVRAREARRRRHPGCPPGVAVRRTVQVVLPAIIDRRGLP